MSSVTQYIINQGILEDTLILVLAIPIIFVIINVARRIFGFRTFGIYTPLLLIILLLIIDIKYGTILFIVVFVPMIIFRYFLKKISFLSMTDIRILDTLTFYFVIISIGLTFLWLPFIKQINLNIITLISIIILGLYSEKLISLWEIKGFKRFISPALESLGLITSSYFLINWELIQNIILKYPLAVLFGSVIIIVLLSKWRWLKLREYIEFKNVIKHVELPEKK